MSKTILTPALCRAGRALLGWDQNQLALAANVSKSVVARFELGTSNVHPNRMAVMQDALERAGLEFIPENGGGLGVRFRHPGGPVVDGPFPPQGKVKTGRPIGS